MGCHLVDWMATSDVLGEIRPSVDLSKRFASIPVIWSLIAELVAQRKTPILDLRPMARNQIIRYGRYKRLHLVATDCRIRGRNSIGFLPTTSHPGRLVASIQSFSTTRAAFHMSRKVATSDSS